MSFGIGNCAWRLEDAYRILNFSLRIVSLDYEREVVFGKRKISLGTESYILELEVVFVNWKLCLGIGNYVWEL